MDRKEILEAAFDKAEAGEDETAVLEVPENEVEQKATQGSEGEGEQEQAGKEGAALEDAASGKAKAKEPPLDPAGGKAKEVKKEPPKKDEALGRAAQAAASGNDGTKAPVSWKPAAKEQWAKLPLDVKQDVLRREKEISNYISQNDHHRKFTEGFANVVRPFEHLIRSQNSTPLQAVRNLMTTAAGLATGNEDQKASIVAEIIGNYKVDIATLDKVLAAGGHKTVNRSASVDPSILQALQPVYGFMNEVQQARQARQARQEQEAEMLIEQSSSKPYFDDLSDDIADLMEIASKRGVVLSLDEAYEKAISLNPEIAKIITSQRAQEEARRNGGTRLAKRRAASTISGSPASGGDGRGSPKNRKEALEAAWDDASS